MKAQINLGGNHNETWSNQKMTDKLVLENTSEYTKDKREGGGQIGVGEEERENKNKQREEKSRGVTWIPRVPACFFFFSFLFYVFVGSSK